MMKEYLYCKEGDLEFPLDESIEVVQSQEGITAQYLVSNVQTQNTFIYAPEINFYLENSEDEISKKIVNVKKLYDIRGAVCDLAQDIDFEQEVGEKLLIVSKKDESPLVNEMNDFGLTSMLIEPYMIKDVNGHIGALHVEIQKGDERLEVECDQIIWFDAPEFAMKQSGCVDPNAIGLEKAIQKVKSSSGVYKYKNFIKYDPKICQYHERREEICGRCADVCPTVSILKEDETKHLVFSHVDCHGCGGCISICPSGALDYSQMPRAAFKEIASFYERNIALIIPKKMEIESLHVSLPKGVLPLATEGEKFLHEAHLMTLLQTSTNPIIFYTDFVSKGSSDAIRIVNEIFQKKYHKQAIYVCENEQELQEAFSKIQPISECQYGFDERGMNKREIFSARLAHLVGNEDLGVIQTGPNVHYGNVNINEANCTLCLSCVGACNVRALTAHPEDNSLRLDPSICTNCGYCEVTCPEENCLSVVYDELSLKPEYFKQSIKAKDELFKCVECGKEFATVKAIEKIAKVMEPKFAGDEAKIRSLYCCADCKPKVTLLAHLEKTEGNI
jgi:ferredoxin